MLYPAGIAFRIQVQLPPLYTLVKWLKEYRPGKQQAPLVNQTKVEEFKILNQAIQTATNRSTEMYNQQKQFVENASHELQPNLPSA